MLVHDFVSQAIQQISSGIRLYNDRSVSIKAHMPEEIEFDIDIVVKSGVQHVRGENDGPSAGRLKITIITANYPNLSKV